MLQLPEKSSKIERLTHGFWVSITSIKPGDMFSQSLTVGTYGLCVSLETRTKDGHFEIDVLWLYNDRIYELRYIGGATVMIP